MLFLLYDNSDQKNSFLGASLDDCVQVCSPKSKNLYMQWMRGCFKVLMCSKKNDTIICWYDFQAVLCFWICKFLFIERNIICLNILLKDKPTMKNRFVSKLYKKALLSRNFKASVTSEYYGKWLNEKLGIDIQYTLIHDVYHDSYECLNRTNPNKFNTVFCGGRNGRDWDFMIEVARLMPQIQFDMVMPKDVYMRYEHLLTSNINAKYDVAYEDFMEILCASSFVCLPLDTEAPAGLIVMFQAAANNKMVITTDTVTTKEYIAKDRGVLLPNEIQQWCNAIECYFQNNKERKNKACALHGFLKTECSELDYIKRIKIMLNK